MNPKKLGFGLMRLPRLNPEDEGSIDLETMKQMVETLGTRNPASIEICPLLVKPDKLQVQLDIKYAAMEIPNDFIVGYGLDYDQQGRNLRDIYTLVKE